MSELEIIDDYGDEKLSRFFYDDDRTLDVISEGIVHISPRILVLYDASKIISIAVDWPRGLISRPESGLWTEEDSEISQIGLSGYLSLAVNRGYNYKREHDKWLKERQEGKHSETIDPEWRRKKFIYWTMKEVKERGVPDNLRDSKYPSLEERPSIHLTVFDIVKQLYRQLFSSEENSKLKPA